MICLASRQTTVDHIVDQMRRAGEVSARKMFGEYGIYCDGKMVALVCDDQLFVKITDAGRELARDLEEAPPYRNAKPCFVISDDLLDDAEWIAALVKATAASLPAPKKKQRR